MQTILIYVQVLFSLTSQTMLLYQTTSKLCNMSYLSGYATFLLSVYIGTSTVLVFDILSHIILWHFLSNDPAATRGVSSSFN
jgi:hypothetical protein